MEQIQQDLFLIKEKGIFGKFKPAVNVYVLAGNNGIIYDAGYGNKRTIKCFIQEINKIEKYYKAQNKQFKITRILLSHGHPDHFSGLKCLRKYLDVKIILTKGTSKIIKSKESFSNHFESSTVQLLKTNYPIKRKYINKMKNIFLPLIYKPFYGLTFLDDPDQIIDEDSEIPINNEIWRIFPSPGHTSDHISLYNEERGILFSGDNILKTSTTWLGPPDSNLKDYLITLENIASLPNLRIIFSAHGDPIENPKERIKELLDNRYHRIEQIMNVIQKFHKKGITPKEIIKELYPNANKMKQVIVQGLVVLTLAYLEENKQIKRLEGKKDVRFFPTAITLK